MDILCSTLLEKTAIKSNNDSLIALADHDNDDLVVIHTKSMLVEEKLRQENRHLLDINRRLEQQKDEWKAKVEALTFKTNEYMTKVNGDMQVSDVHLTTNPQLQEYTFRLWLLLINQLLMN